MEVQKHKVLCVQKIIDTCEMLTYALPRKTYEVVSVHTSAGGLSKALNENFDVIILDSYLPDGSGIELCKRLREAKLQTPIIFYSADVFPYQIEEAMQAGATLYLSKPLLPDAVEQAIKECLRS
jgi:two-component system, OmpR family, alkaline phosphatase synthesis response regulator PhoP